MDSIREQQWHLDAMKAPEMWKTTKGEGVTVAVIDGGFKLDHPDLVGQLLPGKDFSGLQGGVGDFKDGHGTGIASLISGTGKGLGGQGAYGLAPGAKILPLKIKNDTNAGAVSTSEFLDRIGQAITYAADQGAKVINISQAGPANQASSDSVAAVNAAIAHATAKGSLVVAGVGNSAQAGNPVEYPAALPNVVGVGAIDQNVTTTAESEQGPQVDLVAPGIDMYDACTGASGYCKTHGTSDATAIVSASAALLWSVHPDWSANQVLRVLINTAGKPTDGSSRNDGIGYGAVRPRIALTTPGDPGPANVSPIPEPPAGGAAPTAVPSSAAPSTSASPSSAAPTAQSQDSTPVAAPAAQPPAAQPQADKAAESGSTVPIVVAVVVGLLVVAGIVFFVVRRRGAAAPQAGPGTPPAPVGYPHVPGQPPQQQAGPGVPPGPPSYEPPAPPSDNPYAR
ncbi:type VII secretion-associated serine protease mycosin [Kitasatospora sp. NPDC003701]